MRVTTASVLVAAMMLGACGGGGRSERGAPSAACSQWSEIKDVVDEYPPSGDAEQDIGSYGGEVTAALFKIGRDLDSDIGIEEPGEVDEARKHRLFPMAQAVAKLWIGRSPEKWPNDYFGSDDMGTDIATVTKFCR